MLPHPSSYILVSNTLMRARRNRHGVSVDDFQPALPPSSAAVGLVDSGGLSAACAPACTHRWHAHTRGHASVIRHDHKCISSPLIAVAPPEPKKVGAHRGVPPELTKVGTALGVSGVLGPQSVPDLNHLHVSAATGLHGPCVDYGRSALTRFYSSTPRHAAWRDAHPHPG